MGALRYQQRQFFMSYANHWKIDVDAERDMATRSYFKTAK